jgi:ferric-dicitrate binding protein FerR (iron transport regulator)
MPTRKQRRRREKEHRHEYVWEDAEGNEVEPEEVPARKSAAQPQRRAARAPREPQPPSWRRTLKRGLIFAPIMFVVVSFLSPNLTLAAKVGQTVVIALVFIPFSYFLDGVFWRSYQKRIARAERPDGRRGS